MKLELDWISLQLRRLKWMPWANELLLKRSGLSISKSSIFSPQLTTFRAFYCLYKTWCAYFLLKVPLTRHNFTRQKLEKCIVKLENIKSKGCDLRMNFWSRPTLQYPKCVRYVSTILRLSEVQSVGRPVSRFSLRFVFTTWQQFALSHWGNMVGAGGEGGGMRAVDEPWEER